MFERRYQRGGFLLSFFPGIDVLKREGQELAGRGDAISQSNGECWWWQLLSINPKVLHEASLSFHSATAANCRGGPINLWPVACGCGALLTRTQSETHASRRVAKCRSPSPVWDIVPSLAESTREGRQPLTTVCVPSHDFTRCSPTPSPSPNTPPPPQSISPA